MPTSSATVIAYPLQRSGRWYLVSLDNHRDLIRWGHGSTFAANFRLRREALAWAALEGIITVRTPKRNHKNPGRTS